jgi:hypothetical protein
MAMYTNAGVRGWGRLGKGDVSPAYMLHRSTFSAIIELISLTVLFLSCWTTFAVCFETKRSPCSPLRCSIQVRS